MQTQQVLYHEAYSLRINVCSSHLGAHCHCNAIRMLSGFASHELAVVASMIEEGINRLHAKTSLIDVRQPCDFGGCHSHGAVNVDWCSKDKQEKLQNVLGACRD